MNEQYSNELPATDAFYSINEAVKTKGVCVQLCVIEGVRESERAILSFHSSYFDHEALIGCRNR